MSTATTSPTTGAGPALAPYLLDLNVLIALSWPQHVHHARSHAWFDSLESPWATTPFTEAGYLRLTTNPVVVGEAVTMDAALGALRAMRSAAGHVYIADASSLADPAISLDRLATSRQVTDAHLVNLAAVSGVTLATLDRDIATLVSAEHRRHVLVLP